jgi:hypothetical protein
MSGVRPLKALATPCLSTSPPIFFINYNLTNTGHNLTEISYNLLEISHSIRASSEHTRSLLPSVYIYSVLVSCLLDSLSNSTTVLPTACVLIVPFWRSPL